MKKLVLGGSMLAALAMSAPAMAADLPVKAPVYKAPVEVPYDWTGFYVGVNGGYSWGRSATDFTVAGLPLFSTGQNLNGWVFGGQAGYNWQVNRNWLVGVEGDIQATGQKGTLTLPAVGPVCIPIPNTDNSTCTTTTAGFEQKLPWFATLRGRVGVLPSDRWLLYVTGGLAVGEVDTTASIISTSQVFGGVRGTTPQGPPITTALSASNDDTHVGWTVGAGAEWAFWGPWTAKVEYLYVDLGHIDNTFAGIAPFAPFAPTSHVTDNIVRVGVNYRFGGPVVARY